MSDYVKHKKIKELLGVSDSTIRRWANNGTLPHIWTPTGQRMYSTRAVMELQLKKQQNDFKYLQKTNLEKCSSNTEKGAIYVRVSSSKQKDDLERQQNLLLEQYPRYKVYKDIGSGINFKRKGLLALLKHSREGLFNQVVVASKDRLSRIAFELIEWMLLQDNTRIVVFENEHTYKTNEQELGEDLLGIMQIFCCRWNGKRRYRGTNSVLQNKTQPDTDTKKEIDKNVGCL